MPKAYTRMALSEAEFNSLRSLVRDVIPALGGKAQAASSASERAFYEGRVTHYEALQERFEAVLRADTSQDAEEDEDANEEDEADAC